MSGYNVTIGSTSTNVTVGYRPTLGVTQQAYGIVGPAGPGIGTTSSINTTGIITASYFVGDGSLLTNLPGSGNSGYANTAGIATYATSSGIATYATNAGIATYATNAGIATYATSSGIATYATNAGIATFATNAGISTYASTSGIATYATSSGIATYATNAGIATYATNAGIATYATSSGIATYATNAGISTYASTSGIATYASTSGIATYATSAGIATYATNAGIATYASTSGIATNVIGGIASVTSLSVSGITTLGVVTAATSINFSNGGLLGDPYGDGGFGLKSAPNQYATIASNNLQQYIKVDNTTTYIGTGYGSTTGTYDWQFKKDGSTKFPNGLILAPTSQSITLQSDQYSQLFWMNADQTVGPDKFTNVDFFVASGYAVLDIGYRDGASNQQYKSWVWSLSGLQFPDSTVQSTAFTGYADNAGIATVAQELTGTPNISVGVITATDYRIQSVAEKTTIVGLNTANLVYNTGGGNVAICTNPSGDITLNVTGIPTDSAFDNYSLAFSVIATNAGTARSCTAINLNGLSRTIKWFGGSLSAAISGVTTSNGYDVYSFTGINTVGSASTTANYIVLGSVNGSYR